MKKFQEKIKDLVEAKPFEPIQNHTADWLATILSYKFTDATSDLMANWIDGIAGANGAAFALAGHRGVGKSHFLTVLESVAAFPELRSKLSDTHVASSVQRFQRRKFTVVRVERGTGASFAEELCNALADVFKTGKGEWSEEPEAAVAVAAARSGENKLVFIVDSAYARETQVVRDDGALLSCLAEAVKAHGGFVGLALDDDIAGADGVNSAIVGSYTISYLDQEHLYRIVDAYLFQKKAASRPILRELYRTIRTVAPQFNWSEPRFTALYPIHPVIADVTSAVRIYAQRFSFLPFVAEMSGKVMNRPSHSLVSLDELFDRVEHDLRKSEELQEVFEKYDSLLGVVAKIPVMQRLQAKIVLKGLFLLSLSGRKVSAAEMSASLLIYDENQPAAAVEKISSMLETFAAEEDGQIQREEENGEIRYAFGLKESVNFEASLNEAAQQVSDEETEKVLRKFGRARFSDWGFGDGEELSLPYKILWRGASRDGDITWNFAGENIPPANGRISWRVAVKSAEKPSSNQETHAAPLVVWRTAPIKADEREMLKKYVALKTNVELFEAFRDKIVVNEESMATRVEKIWTRVFIEEAQFLRHGERLEFSEKARAAESVRDVLQEIFEPVFAKEFPEHPHFDATLEMDAVSLLVGEFFGGTDANAPSVQNLARNFAEPLGLAVLRGQNYVLGTEKDLVTRPWMRETLKLVGDTPDSLPVTFDRLHELLGGVPYGLTREAQFLILTALVAQRRFEFVTTQGERIGRRSLNLKIDWEDIIGIARSSALTLTPAKMAEWAQLFVSTPLGNSLTDADEREKVRGGLMEFLTDWEGENIFQKFDSLDDAAINTRLWRLASRVRRSFGAVAEVVEELLGDSLALEEALQRIAESFGVSVKQFNICRAELNHLRYFLQTSDRRHILNYVSFAEQTSDEIAERRRKQIIGVFDSYELQTSAETAAEIEAAWAEYHPRYIDFYAAYHDGVMKSSKLGEIVEKIITSSEWAEFETLSTLAIFPAHFWQKAKQLLADAQQVRCSSNVREILEETPHCRCAFRFGKVRSWENLPRDLAETMSRGRSVYSHILLSLSGILAPAFDRYGRGTNDAKKQRRALEFAQAFVNKRDVPNITLSDAEIFEEVLAALDPPTLRLRPPRDLGVASRDEIRDKVSRWLEDLPGHPVLMTLGE